MINKDWLEEIGNTIDTKDSEKFASYITENGIFKFGNQEAVRGRKQIREYVENFFKLIKHSRHEILNYWTQDDAVIWQGRVHYTRLDGKEVTIDFVNIFFLDGELIKEYLIYIDNTPLFAG